MLQLACQPAGLRGGWRDYCIVNAPERSGLGTFVVLLALVSRLAFVVAKRGAVPVSKREPQAPPPPVAKHRAVEGLRRWCARACSVWSRARGARLAPRAAGASWWLSTPPRAEWLTLPQGQDRLSRVTPNLREWTPVSGSLAPAIRFPSRAERLSFGGGVQRGSKEFDQQSNDSFESRGFRLWPGLSPKRCPTASLRGVSRKGWRQTRGQSDGEWRAAAIEGPGDGF